MRASTKCPVSLFEGWYSTSNGITANVVLRDRNLYFQGQTIQVAILTSKGWIIQTLQMPSDRKSGICHRIEPLRMMHIVTMNYIFIFVILTCEYLENGESYSEKFLSMTFLEVDIYNRVGPLRMLYSVTLTKIFKITHWNVNISETVRAIANIRHMTFAEVDIRDRIAPFWMLYSVTLIFIFMV